MAVESKSCIVTHLNRFFLSLSILLLALRAQGAWLDVFSSDLKEARSELLRTEKALDALGHPMIGNTVPEFGIQQRMMEEPPPESPFVQMDLGASQSFDTVALIPAVVDFQGVTQSPYASPVRFRLDASDDAQFAAFTQALAKDQVCLAVIKARTTRTDKADGKGRITVAVQNTQNYKATPLWKGWVVGKEWDTTFFSFAAAHEVPEGAGIAKINVGETQQSIEIADFQIYTFPVGFDIFKAPQMKKTYAGRELDAPWRAAAEERIAKLRQGKITVSVVDAEGKAIEGAKVKLAMKRHLFGFGSAVDVHLLSGLWTPLSQEDQTKYRNTVDDLFSRIVPENGLRVGNIDAELNPEKPWEANGRRRNGVAVQWSLQWAQDRKMTSRGHYLAWCYLEPWATEEVKKGGPAGLLARYDRHFKHVLPFCAPYVDEWDALNHPVPFVEADALYNVVGPDVYPELYAKIRPQTDKLLFVNEDTFNPDRTAGFEKHVKHMIAKGQTPDGCGFQSHFSDYAIPAIDEEWQIYERFGKLAKHLTVTEYDLQTLDDQLHADHLRDMMTLCFSHPQMTGFVIWGFWEKRHWKPTAAMFKNDWTERPAVKVWRDLVKGKWWTNADLTSAADGKAITQGYFGWYDITLEHGGKTKSFEIKHAVSGSKPVLKLE